MKRRMILKGLDYLEVRKRMISIKIHEQIKIIFFFKKMFGTTKIILFITIPIIIVLIITIIVLALRKQKYTAYIHPAPGSSTSSGLSEKTGLAKQIETSMGYSAFGPLQLKSEPEVQPIQDEAAVQNL